MKYCLIKQPAGLGDILFLQKIAHEYNQQGYNIIWPVNKSYDWIGKHLRLYDFPSIDDDFPLKEEYHQTSLCSIRHINEHIIIATDGCGNGVETMKSKYNLCGIDWQDWADYLIFSIDLKKCNELFDHLQLNDIPYVLSMKQMGSPPNHVSNINIPIQTDLHVEYIRFIDGFDLFDWYVVIHKAEELYLEGSSPIYLIEKMQTRAEQNNKMFLFSRDNHKHFNGLFKKPWIWRKESIK